MKLDEYVSHDALGLAGLVRKGAVKPEELLSVAMEAANAVNPEINAIIETWEGEMADQLKNAPAVLASLVGRDHVQQGRNPVVQHGYHNNI